MKKVEPLIYYLTMMLHHLGRKPVPKCVLNKSPSAINTELKFHSTGCPASDMKPHETDGKPWEIWDQNADNQCWKDTAIAAIGGYSPFIKNLYIFTFLHDFTELSISY